jgi:uncharacterized protein involved in tolerance to divalent cations
MVIPCVVTACFELFSKMKTAYTLKEKILLASLIRDMGEAIESKKQTQFRWNGKIVLGK